MTSEDGLINLQTLALVVCVTGILGPVLLWALHQAIARPVSGLLRITKGSALLIPAGISIALNGWADATFATYLGCVLAMTGAAYWYEGFREMSGLASVWSRIPSLIGMHALIMAGIALGASNPSWIIAFNALACAIVIYGCADAGMSAKTLTRAMKVTLSLVFACSALLIVLGAAFSMSTHANHGELRSMLVLLGLALFLCAQGVMVGIAVMASQSVQGVLELEASTDHLTGTLTRRELIRRGEVELSRCMREIVPISVLMLDIDLFKRINDTYGHHVGDTVIIDLAVKIAEVVRPYDLISRYGGEEFVAVLPGASESVAVQIAERIRHIAEMGTPGTPQYTVSIGVYCGNIGGLGSMIRQADVALYEAKEAGRNKVVTCDYNRKKKAAISLVPNGLAKAA